MNYKLAQLILTPGKSATTTSEIFIAQPDAIKEELAGKLFLLIEIESDKAEALKLINFLVDNINYNYYQSEKVLLRERMPSLKIDHIFEGALAKTNKNFAEYLEREKLNFDPGKINVTAGIIHESSLYFANTGKNQVFLIYKVRPEIIKSKVKGRSVSMTAELNGTENEYKISNLTQPSAGASPVNETKLFSDVMSGKIPERSAFVIANEALPEYISSQQLVKIVSTIPPASAVEQIKNLLSSINSYVSFLGIIVKSATAEQPDEERPAAVKNAQSSITGLNQTEEITETLLAPSGMINPKKWLKLPAINFGWFSRNSKLTAGGLYLKDKIIVKRKSLAFIAALTGYIKNGIIYIANLVFFLFRSLSNKDLWRSLPGNLKNLAVTMPRQAFAYLYNLNWKKQALITVAVVAIVILTVNMVIISRRQKTAESIKEYENAASLIEQKQNQVEATLLYSNEEGAKKLFDEIGALINTLPQETDEQKTKYEKFKQTLDEQLAKMRRVTIVSDPAEIANFTNLSSQAQTENIFYAEVNKKIYAGDTSQRSIYIADTGNKLVTSLTDLAQPINTLLYPMINKNNILLFINRNAAIALDTKDDKLNNITARWPAEIAAADIYNNNLYLVDKKNNDILKSESFATSFSTPVKWLKENADLANVVDISIDGSIYLLRANGELARYLKGKQDEFKLSLVDPALTSANKLYVSPEGKHIYILDNTGRRLLVFEKTGDYVMQYQSDKFTGLTDFSVDEKNKTIYVLCDNKVYRFEAENLK